MPGGAWRCPAPGPGRARGRSPGPGGRAPAGDTPAGSCRRRPPRRSDSASRSAYHRPRVTSPTEARLLTVSEGARADPEVDVVPHPLPEPRLVGRLDPGRELMAPALHHLGFGRPEPDPLPRHFLPPVLSHLGARVDQPHGE